MIRTKDIYMDIVYAQIEEEKFLELYKQHGNFTRDWSQEPDDYETLKKDETFCELYKEYRKARKRFNDYKYELREKNELLDSTNNNDNKPS